MISNYFRLAVRNLRLTPANSLVNILSLAIGFSACLVLFLFINNERNYDSLHSQKEDIYRLYTDANYPGASVEKVALTMGWLGPELISDFSEVKSFTRFWNRGKMVADQGGEKKLIENIAAADSTFFDVFDFELIAGNRKQVLDIPNSIVLTEPTATLLFNDPLSALGRDITLGDQVMKVTGVMKAIPENSHLQFSSLVSISTWSRNDKIFLTSWDGSFLNTYVLFHRGADALSFESKLPEFLVRHTGKKDLPESVAIRVQALSDVHLWSSGISHDDNNSRKFNGTYINLFLAIGGLILVIACVNFINLSIARAANRWKEVAVRKSIGAARSVLFWQFSFESVFLSTAALIGAFAITSVFISVLNDAIGRNLRFSLLFSDVTVLSVILLSAIAIGLIAGLYPSLYMTSLKPSVALKNKSVTQQGRSVFGHSLVVVQFALAIGMIIGALVVTQQLSFMTTTNIGFNKDQIILIDMNPEVNSKFAALKNEWLRLNKVAGVTASSQRIGNNFNGWGFKVRMDSGIYNFVPSNVNVDYDYLKVYQIAIENGRDFSDKIPTDQGKAFIINETMAKELGLQNPVGRLAGHAWNDDNNLGTIIGVAKDFNYNSLHNKIGMLAMVCHPEWGYEEISVRIDASNVAESIAAVKEVWDQHVSGYPFNYSFLDDHFASLYRTDDQVQWTVAVMAGCAVLIACIGLFGLASNLASRKVKEIGIRKTLGATSVQIAAAMTNRFVILIGISFALICPVVYYLMSSWLEGFSYRIDLSVITFIAGGVITAMIAILTISYRIIKAGFENPVKSLRYE